MTHTRYILHRIGIALGINRRTQRLTDIASESHLLREAEAHLGKLVWGHLESVEELSAEYWGLRKLTIEHRELHQLIDEKEQELSKLQKEQSGLINKQSESDDPELTSRHDQATQELEGWIQKREKIETRGLIAGHTQ